MIGQTISHYRITAKLGEGGMGVVYKAEDTKLERPVALKFLSPLLVRDEEVRRRFDREAKAAAALNHPNICPVFEIDEADGQTFIAMAFLDGQELAREIALGPSKIERLLDIAEQIARGLEEAHGKGVVHRDIKPANIMLTVQGQAVLMDFGLAQFTRGGSKLTKDGMSLGTCAYMSPEQTTGGKIDHRTDVWALGVVLYEMAAGRLPFQGHYEQATLYSILHDDPEPLTGL
jgi:serine/threonine protein kinase